MFEAVTITGGDLKAGTVAEALIYYGRVDDVVGGGVLVNLTKSFGGENIVRAVDMGALRLVYERTHHVVVSVSEPYRVHNFTGVSLAGSADGKKVRTAQDELDEMFQRNFGKSQETRLLARDLSDRLHERDFRGEISKQAILDVLDAKFMTQARRLGCQQWCQNMLFRQILESRRQILAQDSYSLLGLIMRK